MSPAQVGQQNFHRNENEEMTVEVIIVIVEVLFQSYDCNHFFLFFHFCPYKHTLIFYIHKNAFLTNM